MNMIRLLSDVMTSHYITNKHVQNDTAVSAETVFYLTIRFTNLLKPFRVTADGVAMAAIPRCLESESTGFGSTY